MILWQPTKQQIESSQIHQFALFIEKKFQVHFNSYQSFHRWSVENITDFWSAWWDYSKIIHDNPFHTVLENEKEFWQAKWFVGATLNFAENLLRFRDDKTAIVFCNEHGVQDKISYHDLYEKVAQLVVFLKEQGVEQGDRVAGYLPNMPEAIIAMLATTALGAIWSSTSPDFGEKGVLDRFGQIAPKILFTVNGYWYNGKEISIIEKVNAIRAQIPSLQKTVVINYLNKEETLQDDKIIAYTFIQKNYPANEIDFVPVAADHPLYILYSSGTTGLPKTIVHRTAGILLQHLKEHRLHTDITRKDVLYYFTTTSWMMWNWLVSGLASGCTIVCYDGCPTYPGPAHLWQLVDELGITVFGTSAKYLSTLCEQDFTTKGVAHLNSLRAILSTGSVLPDHCFDYVYEKIKSNVMLSSISGGTDIVSCFILGNPSAPVRKGELQSIGLGLDIQAFDQNGKPVFDQQGELVCASAAPCMPLGFWNDPQHEKYKASYFSHFPNVWYHGDFIIIYNRGGVRVLGRSDATLNPGGVRIGTAEIYAVVEKLAEIEDSLVIGQRWQDDERVILFVKLKNNLLLQPELIEKIKKTIRANCTPRHVPAKIIAVADIPYTMNGKKVELAVKNIIHDLPVKNTSVLKNPECLQGFIGLAELKN